MSKVLIVDDDLILSDVIAFFLRKQGYDTLQVHDGETAIKQWQSENPDMVLLDVNLPGLDGYSVLTRMREQVDTPVIMISVRDQEDEIIHGLRLGADDYMVKPIGVKMLVARMEAVLRRANGHSAPAEYRSGELVFNALRRELQFGEDAPIALAPLESRLMEYLLLNANQVLNNESIIEHVWGIAGADRDALRQLVHRLRQKIEQNDLAITTVPRAGYILHIDR